MEDVNQTPGAVEEVVEDQVAEEQVESEEIPDEVAAASNQAEEQSEEQQTKEEIKSLKRKLKLKVDGEEIEEEIDLNDEEALRRHLQLSKAAQKRMAEAAKQKQQAEKFFRMLKEDPMSVLSDPSIGVDVRQFAEEYLAKQLEEEIMSPEEKKLREAERIIREREEETKKQQEQAQQEQIQKLQEHYSQEYDKKITEALSTSGLPKTPRTVRRMAELMSKNLEHGLDLEPKDLVALVREDYLSEIKELFGQTDGDGLLQLLGDDIANKIRKSDLARLKKQKPQPQVVQSTGTRSEKPNRPMTRDEWREFYDRKVRDE